MRSATDRRLLEARHVSRHFGGVRAVDDVNFDVAEGEVVGLLGPNGSGKSTLLACLAGTLPVSSGRVHLRGRDVTRLSAHKVARAGIARTFQSPKLFESMSILQNVLMATNWADVRLKDQILPMRKAARSRAVRLLEDVGLGDLLDHPAGQLSGGQQRLLEVVMAVMPGPQLVMLDEATSGVSPALTDALGEQVRRMNREQGVSFVVVEHDVDFVMDLADRVVVLDQGRVLATGTPDDVSTNKEVADVYLGT